MNKDLERDILFGRVLEDLEANDLISAKIHVMKMGDVSEDEDKRMNEMMNSKPSDEARIRRLGYGW
jgi:hypothetical protein